MKYDYIVYEETKMQNIKLLLAIGAVVVSAVIAIFIV